MARKQCVIGSTLFIVGLIFIIMSALTPMIVDESLKTQAKEKAILKKSNHESLWGKVPGKLNSVVFQTYNFFNLENPYQVL